MSYTDARTGAALIERTDRAVARLFGRDPVRMIQGLATNDVANAPVDAPVYCGFLTPKGKLVGDARVMRRANGEVWVEADVRALDNLEAHFKKSVPPLTALQEELISAQKMSDALQLKATEAAQVATSSSYTCSLMPKPPPTSGVITRTSCSCSSKHSA